MRGRVRLGIAAALLLVALLVASRAARAQTGRDRPSHESAAGPVGHGAPGQQQPHGIAAPPHGGPVQAHGDAPSHAHDAHAEHDETAPPPPINWYHGILGEKADQPPSLLWREPGEPPPFLASLINFAALIAFAVVVGKKPLRQALSKRKETLLREIDEAQGIRKAAEKRLAEYEAKLERIQEELERVRRDFREQGEKDKERIVREAKERRERLKKDTEILLSQEAKQLRHELVVEVVNLATQRATELLAKEITLGDHQRFAETFLSELHSEGRVQGSVSATAAAKGGLS